ncbi:hypothetical protein D9M68_984740 [compost metagenome]
MFFHEYFHPILPAKLLVLLPGDELGVAFALGALRLNTGPHRCFAGISCVLLGDFLRLYFQLLLLRQ